MNSKYPSTTKVLCATSIASLIASSSADATVHSYTFSSNNTVTSTWLHIDLDGGTISYSKNGNSDFMLCRKNTGENGLAIGFSTVFRNSFKEELSNSGKLLALSKSATISVGKHFGQNTHVFYSSSGNVTAQAVGFKAGTNYIGFSFLTNGKTCYGWLEINITDSNTVTLLGWAYSDSGSILAGLTTAVPEPAETAIGLGALALGAAGLRRWRKCRAS
jgi:hypothetical protein